MTEKVVVLGAGYAGAGALTSLEENLADSVELTWIADQDYHFVLHEAHRCIGDPGVADHISIPVESIMDPGTRFVEGEAVGIDTDERAVVLADDTTVGFDHLVVAIGSRTAFFGIDGLREHAHTLKSRADAVGIHDAVCAAADRATAADPARIVVGGAGLSGIQVAGELAALRDARDLPVAIHLVEGLESVLPNGAPALQDALAARLAARDIAVSTGEFVSGVDAATVSVGEATELGYDELIWTGGITGRAAVRESDLAQDDRSHRVFADRDFQTSDSRVFAIGDCALVDQPGDDPAPPTAQAAWQAADVAGANVARAVRGDPLRTWTYEDRGTVVSVGDDAVAHDVSVQGVAVPVDTFGGLPARTLKKAIAAKWIASITGPRRAARAWPHM